MSLSECLFNVWQCSYFFFFHGSGHFFCRWSTGVFSCWLIFNSHTFVCFSFQLKKKHASYTLCSFLFTSDRLLTGLLTARFFFFPPAIIDIACTAFERSFYFFFFFFLNFVFLSQVSALTQESVGSSRDLWLPHGQHRLNSWRADSLAWVTSGIYTFA